MESSNTTLLPIPCPKCGRNGNHEGECATKTQVFYWRYGGNEVYLVADFNYWGKSGSSKMLRDKEAKDVFMKKVNLAPGTYRYKFVVDGQWMYDQAERFESDGFGGFNNIHEVKPMNLPNLSSEPDSDDNRMPLTMTIQSIDSDSGLGLPQRKTVTLRWSDRAKDVKVRGSWDGWTKDVELHEVCNPISGRIEFIGKVELLPGTYQYKFVVDGVWRCDEWKELSYENGTENNVLFVKQGIKIPRRLITSNRFRWKRKNIVLNEDLWQLALEGHSMDLVGDFCYIFGGRKTEKFINNLITINMLNFTLDAPDQQGAIPDPRAYHLTCVFGSKIILLGGYNEKSLLNDYYVFSTASHVWRKGNLNGPETPRPREWASLAQSMKSQPDVLLLFGGYFYTQDLEYEENLNDLWSLDLTKASWCRVKYEGTPPLPRSGHTAVTIGHKMYVFGGVELQGGSPRTYFNDIHYLKSKPEEPPFWTEIKPLGECPPGRTGHSCNVYGEDLIIFGGKSNKRLLNDIWVFDTRKSIWTRLQTVDGEPSSRYRHKAIVHEDSLILFGGITGGRLGHLRFLHKLNLKGYDGEDEEDEIQDDEMNPARNVARFCYY